MESLLRAVNSTNDFEAEMSQRFGGSGATISEEVPTPYTLKLIPWPLDPALIGLQTLLLKPKQPFHFCNPAKYARINTDCYT